LLYSPNFLSLSRPGSFAAATDMEQRRALSATSEKSASPRDISIGGFFFAIKSTPTHDQQGFFDALDIRYCVTWTYLCIQRQQRYNSIVAGPQIILSLYYREIRRCSLINYELFSHRYILRSSYSSPWNIKYILFTVCLR